MSLYRLSDGEVFDFRFAMLDEVITVLDGHLTRLDESFAGCETLLDQFSVYDSFDHFLGIGFAAAQVYVAGTAAELGLSRVRAMALGPLHRTGQPVVGLVCHAANYWKHRDEWGDDPDTRAQRTVQGVQCLDFDPIDFPLVDMLRDMAGVQDMHKVRLRLLLGDLLAWRDSAIGVADAESTSSQDGA
jgi:hypothetical protein